MLLFWQMTSIGFCIALGVLIGLRVRRRGVKPWAWRHVPDAITLQPEIANELLTQLHESTMNSIESVRHHTDRLRKTNEELDLALGEATGITTPFHYLIDGIMEDNGKLETELLNANSLIEIHAAHIQCQLDDMLTDPVTVIPNRRACDYELKRRFAEWLRTETPFSVLMVDVDLFKKLNDRYGHQAGDKVLRQIGHLFIGKLRQMDMPARFGGEEFVAVLPETRLKDAVEAAERLRIAIDSTMFDIGEGRHVQLTVSVGVAEVNRSDRSSDSLVRRADEALYVSKEAGRNCTHQHDGEQCHPIEPPRVTSSANEENGANKLAPGNV